MKSPGELGPKAPPPAAGAKTQGVMRWRSAMLVLLVAATAAVWASCSDDEKNPVFCGDGTPDPTIENIWPNDDRTYWTYAVTVRVWDDLEDGVPCDSLYQSEEEVPPLPSLDEIENLLKHPALADSYRIYTATYAQEFAGDTTSGSGVPGQNLREILTRPGGSGMPEMPRARIDPLIARLYLARPDLRDAIEHHLGEDARLIPASAGAASPSGFGCFSLECPLFIHGGTWEKTDTWIGTYGDIDTALAWKFLEADLSTGHQFTHQLIPLLAPDIFLHCRVVGITQATTVKCIYRKALDCIYVVDYGVYPVPGSSGQTKGYIRSYDYGRVLYVPGVGPVYCYERLLACTGTTTGLGYGDRMLSLIDTGTRSP